MDEFQSKSGNQNADDKERSVTIENTESVEKIKKPTIDSFISFLKLLVIIIGAYLSIMEYLSFKKESQQLTLEKQKFDVEQQAITREQQKLSVEMTRLSLASHKLSNQQKRNELKYHAEARILFDEPVLEIKLVKKIDAETNLYSVDFMLGAENISKEEFEITYSLIGYSLGSIKEELIESKSINHISDPQSPLEKKLSNGNVLWKSMGLTAYLYEASELIDYPRLVVSKMTSKENIFSGGGLVGSLKSGEKAAFHNNYVVRASENDLIGFTVDLGVDGGKGRNVWSINEWDYLYNADLHK